MRLTEIHGRVIDKYWVKENYHGEEELIIPEGFLVIATEAFRKNYACNTDNLKRIILPDSLVEIGEEAFRDSGLQEVIMGNSVRVIDDYAFYGCHALEKVSLSESLYKIGHDVFSDCVSLKEIFMPDSVVAIGENLFYKCESLETVDLSENLYAIPGNTFLRCKNLKEITVPDSVETIGVSAFEECESLKTADLGKVRQINEKAFRCCFSLEHVNFGDKLSELKEISFSSCNSLKEISLPDTIEWLGHRAFARCKSLETVNLPKGLVEVSPQVFEDTVFAKNTPYIEIGGTLFDVHEEYFTFSNQKEFYVPEYIHTIKACAFEGLDNISDIELFLPKNLQICHGYIPINHVHIENNILIFEKDTFSPGTKIDFFVEDCIPTSIVLKDYWREGNAEQLYNFLSAPTYNNFREIKDADYKVALAISFGMSENDEYKEYQNYLKRTGDRAIIKMIDDENFDALSFYTEANLITPKACETGIQYAIEKEAHEASVILMQYKNRCKGYKKNISSKFDL